MSTARQAPGRLVVISAPSGAGKTTLVRELLVRGPSLRFSISYTTRPPRAAEVNGEDYFFVDEQQFERMRTQDEFLESARVFDHWYGTGRAHVDALLASGVSVLLEIDWQGAQQIRGGASDAVGIFILPPSKRELERRLRGRRTDSELVIARRLADAVDDMSHWREFDFVVINDDVDAAADRLVRILHGSGQEFATSNAATAAQVEQMLTA